MEKMTWPEAVKYLRDYNRKHNITSKGDGPNCEMVAVISEDSFNRSYTLEERSYVFSNHNKAFMPNMCDYSIFANSLDGSDRGVRLEIYITTGSKYEWKVDYCYIKSED